MSIIGGVRNNHDGDQQRGYVGNLIMLLERGGAGRRL